MKLTVLKVMYGTFEERLIILRESDNKQLGTLDYKTSIISYNDFNNLFDEDEGFYVKVSNFELSGNDWGEYEGVVLAWCATKEGLL